MNFQNLNLERLGAMVPGTDCNDILALSIIKRHRIPHTSRGGTVFVDMNIIRAIWSQERKGRRA